jgi:metallothionein
MSEEKKCAHPACACHARKDDDYCSTYCEGEAKTADIICSCGHPGCTSAEAATRL